MHKRIKLRSIQAFILFFLVITTYGTQLLAAGTTDDVITNVQRNYPEYFKQNSIISDALRVIGWVLIQLFRMVADFCVKLYDHSLGFFSLVATDINELIPNAQGLFTAILAVCIMAIGITLIIFPKKKPDILLSLFLVVMALSLQSVILVPLSKPTQSAVREIAQTDSYVDKIISSHIHDLIYIDETLDNGLADLASGDIEIDKLTTELSESRIDNLEVTEIVNYENERLSDQASGKDGILGKRLEIYTGVDGTEETELVEIYNGFGWNDGESDDLFNEFFYRYKIDTIEIILALLATLIVYLILAYKVIRIVVEIVIGNILAIFYSANFNGNQKVLQIFKEILNAFIVLLLSSVMVRVFLLGEQVLSSMDISGIEYGLLLIFLAFAVIDGPNIIQRIVGIDAGISSELGKVFAMTQAVNMTAAAGGAAGRMAFNAALVTGRGIKSIAGSVGNFINNNGNNHMPPPDFKENGHSVDGANTDEMIGNRTQSEDTPSSASDTENLSGTYQEADIPPSADAYSGGTGSYQEADIPPSADESTDMTGFYQEADVPPSADVSAQDMENDMPTSNSELNESANSAANMTATNQKEPGKFAGVSSEIERQHNSLDLSRETQRSNRDIAADMNNSLSSRHADASDLTGISGITQPKVTSMDKDQEIFFMKGNEDE